jgi:very-long-chain ceramide synthase
MYNLGISLTILSTLLAAHNLYPSVQSFTAPFFQMSYYHPETGLYTQGYDDVYFVFSAFLAFTAVRGICMDWIFNPLSRYCGLKKKTSVRVAEQAWLVCYDLTYWSYGMVSFSTLGDSGPVGASVAS